MHFCWVKSGFVPLRQSMQGLPGLGTILPVLQKNGQPVKGVFTQDVSINLGQFSNSMLELSRRFIDLHPEKGLKPTTFSKPRKKPREFSLRTIAVP